jgi:hypothetical protein
MAPSFVRVPLFKDSMMDGVPATYLGRIVSKEHFRVFVYSPDGNKKLVESWEEFEGHMQTGVWFATPEDAIVVVADIEPETDERSKSKPKVTRTKKQDAAKTLELTKEEYSCTQETNNDLAFEVKDDFLSDARK